MPETGVRSLYPRFSEDRLKAALGDTPVVLLIGPRQAGKSTLVQQFSIVDDRTYLTLDDQNSFFRPSGIPKAWCPPDKGSRSTKFNGLPIFFWPSKNPLTRTGDPDDFS